MDDLNDEVRSAARITARRWFDVVEADDVEQGIWVRLLEADYVERLSEMEPAARASVLRRMGGQIASQERDDLEVFAGQITYGTDEVRALLSAGFLDRRQEEIDVNSESMASWLDLHDAAGAVGKRHADVLWSRFVHGDYTDDTTFRKAVQRAVDALTREMNRVNTRRFAEYYEGPGSRPALSNAQARAITYRESE